MHPARPAQHHCSFANCLVTARAVLTESSANGLSGPFLNVTITIVLREFGSSTGNRF